MTKQDSTTGVEKEHQHDFVTACFDCGKIESQPLLDSLRSQNAQLRDAWSQLKSAVKESQQAAFAMSQEMGLSSESRHDYEVREKAWTSLLNTINALESKQ